EKVYNLEVEDAHTYYVSESGVLVHNTSYDVKPDGRALSKIEAQALAEELKKKGANKIDTEKLVAVLESHGVSPTELRKIVDDFRLSGGPNSTKFTDSQIIEVYNFRKDLGLDGGNLPDFLRSDYFSSDRPEYYQFSENTKLKYKFNMKGEGYYNVANQTLPETHKYGTKGLVETLSNTIEAWKQMYPNDPIPVNDLGYHTGGGDPRAGTTPKVVSHHQGGVKMDLGFMTDVPKTYAGEYFDNSHYSRSKTIEFIETLARSAPDGYKVVKILFNDPVVKNYFDNHPDPRMNSIVKPKPGHANHLDVEVQRDGN
ncbi:hypothetical protein, partial [Leptospira neocaledonica]